MIYLLLGAVPPPVGGVSIYCMRKIELLTLNGKEVHFFDSRRKINLLKLILFSFLLRIKRKEYEIEINISNSLVLLVLTIFGLASCCVFYDHNSSRRLLSGKFNTCVFTFFCSKVNRIKTVNENLVNNYNELLKGRNVSITVETPFLAPTKNEIKKSKEKFPLELKGLISDGKRNIILSSAWKPISTEHENDLYGIKDTLAIYRKNISNYPEFIFILMIGELDSSEFSSEIQLLVHELTSFSNFEFIEGGFSQLPLLNRTIALLRLTKTDGDSVSIREALHFGANVIATNVSERPDNVNVVPVSDLIETQNELLKILN